MSKYKNPLVAVTRNNKSNIVDVTGGTLLIVLTQQLPESYLYKSWLVTAVPAVTTSVIFLWKKIAQEFSLFKNRTNTRRQRKFVTKVVDQTLSYPNISSKVKESIREQWEKMQLAFIQEQIRQLNALIDQSSENSF